MTARLQRSTLVRDVAKALRQRILRGKVRPGEYLPSRKDLAAEFGVGMSTVHEALQALSAVGLVASHPGKGTWVREDALVTMIHPDAIEGRLGELDARQVYEARSTIEVALTELAAERATAEDVDQIWQALGTMEAAIDDDESFTRADLAFHLAVARAGKNVLLEQLYHLSRRMLSDVIADWVAKPGVKEESLRIQRTIAQTIERGDPVQARQVALDHMAFIAGLLDEH
jgi:GntR family transcriptional repressor for pyruvate dehydrogenase complex